MEFKENTELCHCKHVTLTDIDRALAQTNRFSDVEREFQECSSFSSQGQPDFLIFPETLLRSLPCSVLPLIACLYSIPN